jgi:NTE family protein
VSGADAVIGTSAGSVVGFTVASGGDLTQAIAMVGAASGSGDSDDPAPVDDSMAGDAATGLEQLMATVAEAAVRPDEAEAIRAGLGQTALAASTISEDRWLAMFGSLAGAEWPSGFSCTAVDAATGRFRVWDSEAGIDVQHAVASSCAVPGIFPPVTIGASRWMDGGVRDMINADTASGHQTVLVVSCTLLEIPEELATPAICAMFAATRAQLDGLAQGGTKVETIVPSDEMLEISGWGLNLMDFARAAAAYEAGIRQGETAAIGLSGFWSP